MTREELVEELVVAIRDWKKATANVMSVVETVVMTGNPITMEDDDIEEKELMFVDCKMKEARVIEISDKIDDIDLGETSATTKKALEDL